MTLLSRITPVPLNAVLDSRLEELLKKLIENSGLIYSETGDVGDTLDAIWLEIRGLTGREVNFEIKYNRLLKELTDSRDKQDKAIAEIRGIATTTQEGLVVVVDTLANVPINLKEDIYGDHPQKCEGVKDLQVRPGPRGS